MFQVDERGHLARTLLASLNRTSQDLACQIDLEFQPGAFFKALTEPKDRSADAARFSEIIRFRGSVLEFHAHLPAGTWEQPCQGLYNILDFAAGQFDPSTLMLFVIANHLHTERSDPGFQCWGCLALKRLLQLGAQATAAGYAVGSLQIATALLDLAGVTILLEAGIDPNDIGDMGSEIGTPDRGPMFKSFNCVRGRSPLNILRERQVVHLKTKNVWFQRFEPSPAESLDEILTQYGARDFTTSADPDLSLATGMGMMNIADDGTDASMVQQKTTAVSS
jgi:hypothetical protein